METCFADEESNVLFTALKNAVKSYSGSDPNDNNVMYDYIEQVPQASLIAELVLELHLLGYKICKQQQK